MVILTDVCTVVFHSSSVIFVYSRNLFIFEACGSAISTRITDAGIFVFIFCSSPLPKQLSYRATNFRDVCATLSLIFWHSRQS